MANSDFVEPVRKEYRIGDVNYNRPTSESLFNTVAGTNNFVARYQTDIKEFKLNGSFSLATNIAFYDGPATFFYNSEIVGIAFSQESGGVGITSFDVRYRDQSDVDQGSILNTQASINTSNTVRAFKNLTTGLEVNPTGTILPVFSKTQFLEGEAIYLVLTSAMTQAFNGTVTIFYKPIN